MSRQKHTPPSKSLKAPPKDSLAILHKTYPHLKHYIDFKNPYQLLIATILSAQIRDTVVNAATPALFAKYPTPKDLAAANITDIVPLIKDITFAGKKVDYIKEAAKQLVKNFDSVVPRTVDELTTLPGVGQKSAHAILQNAYGIIEGVVCDTHVLRVSYRLGWASTPTNASKTERELEELIPKSEWGNIPKLMKPFGRETCRAPTPICSKCPLSKICPRIGVTKST